MPINWDEIAESSANETDEQFKNKISSLTSLNDAQIESLIMESGISKENLSKVLKEVNDASKSNNDKASAISNISGGVNVLIEVASKFI